MLTGELSVATAEKLLLRYSPVRYKPGAECPSWLEFLSQIWADNDNPSEMISFMQELFGYSLSGLMEAQKVFIHFGTGCNGKSKVLDCLNYLTGDYTTRISCNSFSKSKNALVSEFNRLGAKLEGKRCALLDDLDSSTQWNEGFVKNLTGDTMLSRRLYEEERDIPNRCKLHFGCNEAPKPESENYGILRRLCIMPYLRQFKPSMTKEAELRQMIVREASGVLNWATAGLRRVVQEQAGQLNYPREVLMTVEEYKEENFDIERLVREMFAPVEQGEENSWYAGTKLLEDLNQQLERHDLSYKKLTLETLGRTLKSVLRVPMKRATVNGKRDRFYQLKLKYDESNLGDKIAQLPGWN